MFNNIIFIEQLEISKVIQKSYSSYLLLKRSFGYLMPWISAKYWLTVSLSKIALLHLLFERILAGSVRSMCCVSWWAAIKYLGALKSNWEPISGWISLPVLTSFQSVVHDSNDIVNFCVMVTLNILCVLGAGNYSSYMLT